MRIGLLVVVLMVLGGGAHAAPLNAVIGDAGWRERVSPDAPDADKIAAHLAHVEGVLRAASDSHPAAVRDARLAVLDRLAAYRQARQFPHNTYALDRVPVFVDADGRRCAVGALAEHDLGAAEIDRIGAAYRLARLDGIDDPALTAWIARSGFTLRELAMIQPEYGPGPVTETPRMLRERREQWAVTATLYAARSLCEAELFPEPATLPDHVVEVIPRTGAITWKADAGVPEAWKTCFARYVKKMMPAKLGKQTVLIGQPELGPLVSATNVLRPARGQNFMQHRLERALAACKIPKLDAKVSNGYPIAIDVEREGTVTLATTEGLPEKAAACAQKEIQSWKLPAGAEKRDRWNLQVQPFTVAQRIAEGTRQAKLRMKQN